MWKVGALERESKDRAGTAAQEQAAAQEMGRGREEGGLLLWLSAVRGGGRVRSLPVGGRGTGKGSLMPAAIHTCFC